MKKTNRDNLKEVVQLFLWLGFTAFGGPAAHIALYHDQVVKKRKWLDEQHFLDLMGASHLIPGPNSTEMVIYLSYYRAGWVGLVLGGISFILPAMLMVIGLAWVYMRFGGLPQISGVLFAVKPVVIAIIAKALWSLGKLAIKDKWTGLAALAVFALSWAGANNIALMLLAGLFIVLVKRIPASLPKDGKTGALLPFASPFAGMIAPQPFNLGMLFFSFLKSAASSMAAGTCFWLFSSPILWTGWAG